MYALYAIGRTGVTSLLLNRARSVATVLTVVALLVPYLTAVAISDGVKQQAVWSIEDGADLYVSCRQFGRFAPIPLSMVEPLRELPGVEEVVPRIVGRIRLGRDQVDAVLVGVPINHLASTVRGVDGRLFEKKGSNELVIGQELAEQLQLKVGSMIPPFYHSRSGDHVSKIVGVFRAQASLWQSRVVFTDFQSAAHIFDHDSVATDLLIYSRPEYVNDLQALIHRTLSLGLQDATPELRILSKDALRSAVLRSVMNRQAIFGIHWMALLAAGVGLVNVTSGIGLQQRSQEVAILKAVGWHTEQILFRNFIENLCLVLFAAALSVLICFVWLRWLNGVWIASLFIQGASLSPSFTVPASINGLTAFLSVLLSFVLVMIGSLYSTWRAASQPPGKLLA